MNMPRIMCGIVVLLLSPQQVFSSSHANDVALANDACARLSRTEAVCQEAVRNGQIRRAEIEAEYQVKRAYCYYNQKMWRVFSEEKASYYRSLAELAAATLPHQIGLIEELRKNFEAHNVSGDVSNRVGEFIRLEMESARARVESLRSLSRDSEESAARFRLAEAQSQEEFESRGAQNGELPSNEFSYFRFLDRNQKKCERWRDDQLELLEKEVETCRARFAEACRSQLRG